MHRLKKVLVIFLSCLLILLGGSGTIIYYHDQFIEGIILDGSDFIDSAPSGQQQGYSERRTQLNEQIQSGVYDFNSIFEDCFFVGDSRTVGMTDSGYLDSSKTCAQIGVSVDHLAWHMEEVAAQNPKILIVSYGVNDAATYGSNVDSFIDNYASILADVKALLPNTTIYVNSILPVKDQCQNVHNGDITLYNDALKELCQQDNYIYIDNTEVAEEGADLYSGDGLHFLPDFYPIWLVHIAEAICEQEESSDLF